MQASSAALGVDIQEAYAAKDHSYFSGARHDFVQFLPKDNTAEILEIGCGAGATGALALQEGRAGHYVGIELMPSAAAIARGKLTEVIVGDVENMTLDWRPARFDALILSEVIEHLREPDRTLSKLSPFIRPGAFVLASSPNVAHWRVIQTLFKGDFPLEDRGVFDRTHLRWFTPQTYTALFERNGLEVLWAGPICAPSWKAKLISRLTRGAFDHLFMTQICVLARKRN